MKLLGLLGGMSWHSTSIYYKLLNEQAQNALGGHHTARLILWSFDFHEITEPKARDDWRTISNKVVHAARNLELAGAEGLVICSNTMHRIAKEVASNVSIPLIDIIEETAKAIQKQGKRKPALLATRYMLEDDYALNRFQNEYQLDLLLPGNEARTLINTVIYDELCKGIVSRHSKEAIIKALHSAEFGGADSVILGCTELGLMFSKEDFTLPVFDTTKIHSRAALDFALTP